MHTYTECGIEQVTPAQVLEFIDNILKRECRLQVRGRLARSIHKYFAEFQPEQKLFTVLLRDGVLCGLLATDCVNSSRAILKWIFVRPEDRGRGLGARLVDRAIAFTRASGYRKLVLGTLTDMKAAHRLYEKRGFVFKQQVSFWHQPMLVYEKELAPEPGVGPSAPNPS